jgi:phosphatidylglycerol lysyltransferase
MRDIAGWVRAHRTYVSLGLIGILLFIAFTALHRLTETVHLADVRAAFHSIALPQIAISIALTIVSYMALTFYDYLALQIIDRPLPWRTAATASFVSYTLSHNLGLAPITGGSARYRIYTGAGLAGADVARVIAIAGSTFWMGVMATAGGALAVHQTPIAIAGLEVDLATARVIGDLVIFATLSILLFCAFGPRQLNIFGWSLPLPSARLAVGQIGIASIDLAAASAALFILIPGADPAFLPTFVFAYALAIIATLVTHVPGGLGVFEAVIMAVVPVDKATLFAALVAYRMVYYLLPLTLGIVTLAIHEGKQRRVVRTLASVRVVASGLAPLLMSAANLLGGAFLLLSGSTPGIPARLQALHALLPLPFIEASHLAASLTGTGLILLAPGLYRRLDGAFVATRTLLLAGAAFSLAKGIDYEEAITCLVIAGLLQWTSPAFYRSTALIGRPFSTTWLACVAAISGLTIWLGLFSYKHVDYDNSLWWEFALHGDASRYLRASLGVVIILFSVSVWRLFSPASARNALPAPWDEVQHVLEQAERSDAMLSLTGDKRFLFSPNGDTFLMYQIKGSSWIVMADPVGPKENWRDLLWTIRAMADAAQGRLMLYQISTDMLEIAIELGLQIIKYGEEALVDLQTFSLEGPQMRSLRHTERRAGREGVRFDVVPAEAVPSLLPELETVSEQWLEAKGHREKGFSLGRFDPAYLCRCDCAVVRVSGTIVAFANVWRTANKQEMSVDLMRHGEGSPPGVMDYLFVNLMLWGKAEGYRSFSLGLAPLSGIDGHRLSPAWAKAASILFRHGERFYGFRGLRAYKEKFGPVWQPRYVAAPRGLGFIKAMRDLNRLIGRPSPVVELDDLLQ